MGLFLLFFCPLISKGPRPQKPQVGYSYCFWSSLNKLIEVKQQTHGVSHCLWGGNRIPGCLADNDSFLKECKLFSQKDNLVQFTADLRVSPSFSDTRSWSMDVYTWSILERTKLFGQAMAPKKTYPPHSFKRSKISRIISKHQHPQIVGFFLEEPYPNCQLWECNLRFEAMNLQSLGLKSEDKERRWLVSIYSYRGSRVCDGCLYFVYVGCRFDSRGFYVAVYLSRFFFESGLLYLQLVANPNNLILRHVPKMQHHTTWKTRFILPWLW